MVVRGVFTLCLLWLKKGSKRPCFEITRGTNLFIRSNIIVSDNIVTDDIRDVLSIAQNLVGILAKVAFLSRLLVIV